MTDEEGPEDERAPEAREDSPRVEELRPARPDASLPDVRASYMPRIGWRWLIAGITLMGVLVGGYVYRQQLRTDNLRSELVTAHQQNLSELSRRYMDFRGHLERWVIQSSSAGGPTRFVDPRLNLEGLRSGDGLYLRVPVAYSHTSDQITAAALTMEPDAITRCMGIAPVSARGLYERGDFLTPQWIDNLRHENDLMRLRVFDDQLQRHVQVDVPVVTSMMHSDWFMLVIQQGENRRDSPVDVYLWDLHERRQLLRARIQGRGLLVPVRLRFPGITPAPAPARPSMTSGGAQDCSIASQIRALTGGQPIGFDSAQVLIDAAQHDEHPAAPAAPVPAVPQP